VVRESDVERRNEKVERLPRGMLVHGAEGRRLRLFVHRDKGRCVSDVFVVSVLERPEELLVAGDVLTAVGLNASVNRALGAFMCKCLGEPGELGDLDVLHSSAAGTRRGCSTTVR